jgi:hypothetical protein
MRRLGTCACAAATAASAGVCSLPARPALSAAKGPRLSAPAPTPGDTRTGTCVPAYARARRPIGQHGTSRCTRLRWLAAFRRETSVAQRHDQEGGYDQACLSGAQVPWVWPLRTGSRNAWACARAWGRVTAASPLSWASLRYLGVQAAGGPGKLVAALPADGPGNDQRRPACAAAPTTPPPECSG